MNNAKVISVNPNVKNVDVLNITSFNIEPLTRAMSAPAHSSIRFKNTLNLIFGINSGVNPQFSAKMMSVRMIAGLIITVMSVLMLTGRVATEISPVMSWASLILGVSILAGFFTRIISCAGALTFGFAFLSTLGESGLNFAFLALAAASLIFMVLGPGRFSADLFIRHLIHRVYRNAHRYDPERNPDNIVYNAFGRVDRIIR